MPLQEQLINKAKACEEVILFERGELKCAISQQNVRQIYASPTNGSSGGVRIVKGSPTGKDIVSTKAGSPP